MLNRRWDDKILYAKCSTVDRPIACLTLGDKIAIKGLISSAYKSPQEPLQSNEDETSTMVENVYRKMVIVIFTSARIHNVRSGIPSNL